MGLELWSGDMTPLSFRPVDARRISSLLGREIHMRLKGARKECGCFESKDIGDYDTCPHGCVYCYAVQNRRLAQERFREHAPEGEFLFKHATHTESEPTFEA